MPEDASDDAPLTAHDAASSSGSIAREAAVRLVGAPDYRFSSEAAAGERRCGLGTYGAMRDPLERVYKGRVAALALVAAGAAWAFRARARAREQAERLAEAEWQAQWDAAAPERERRKQEEEERRRERERQRLEAFTAAAEAKGWRYETVGQCHLDHGKKCFATKLDAQICTWVQREKHGGELQRAYRCDGRDTRDGDGCGSWHLTSKSAFT
jgi:hypothetical protein